MTTISWARCGQILAELSADERIGLQAIARDHVRSLPAPVLKKLAAQQLAKFDGQSWVLTDDGHVVAYWSGIVRHQRRKGRV